MSLKRKITIVISVVFLAITTLLGFVFFITMSDSLQKDVESEAEQVCQTAAYTVQKNIYSDIYVLRAMMAHSNIVSASSLDFKIRTIEQIVNLFEYEYILLIWDGEYYRIGNESYVKGWPETDLSISAESENVLFGRLYSREADGLLIAEPISTSEDGIEYQMVLKRPENWIYQDLMSSESLQDKNVMVSTTEGQILYPDRFEDMQTPPPERMPEATMQQITLNGPEHEQDLYAYSMSVENMPFNITAFVDQDQKTEKLREYVVNYLMLTACSLVIIAVTIYGLSKHLTKAVSGLAQFVEKSDQPGGVPEVFTKRKDEAGVLARAFSSLMARLHSTIDEKEYIAYHDQLTSLPNRYEMVQDISELLTTGESFVFALMDIDNFKGINDWLGHMQGDHVLSKVATLLRKFGGQTLKAYRWGGDEFGVVLYGDDKETCRRTLERILQETASGFDELEMIKISVSIGVCICPKYANTQKAMLQNADNALKEAKRRGKNQYCFYEETHDEL